MDGKQLCGIRNISSPATLYYVMVRFIYYFTASHDSQKLQQENYLRKTVTEK